MLSTSKGMASEIGNIDFYQIYYKDEQLSELYDFAIPYKNLTLTPYFENSVICELVPKSTADKICVASWRLRQKRKNLFRIKENIDLTDQDYDIAILTPRSPSHKPLVMARHWHNPAWDIAITELKKFIKVPKEITAIYENHFIASKDIYQRYISDCLQPCIDFMSSNSVFLLDSGYAKNKPAEEVLKYRELTGRNDWPIGVFVLERLFSIWIAKQNFKIVVR